MTSERWKWLFLDLVLPLAVTLGLTWYFAANNKDLAIERDFYDAESASWKTGDDPLWRVVYSFGPLPAAIVAVGSVLIFVIGFGWGKLARFRRASAFLFLVAAIAAGLIANLILKENWGRPRPREVVEFGGRYEFEPVLTIDPLSDGRSFPCGHATMGFFFVAFYFLLRKSKPGWSALSLLIGLGFGTLLGFTRMLQGGHFASDVVWAGAVTFFSAAGLFYIMRLNRSVLDHPIPEAERRKIPLKVKIFGAVAILAGCAGVLLSTPYSEKRNFTVVSDAADDTELKISLIIIYGDVTIRGGDAFSIQGEAWGHGVPTSKIADRLDEEIEEDGALKLGYKQHWSGHLSEVDQRLTITVPWDRVRYLKLQLSDSQATVTLSPQTKPIRWDLITERASVVVQTETDTVQIAAESEDEETIQNEMGKNVQFYDELSSKIDSYRVSWRRIDGDELIFRVNPEK